MMADRGAWVRLGLLGGIYIPLEAIRKGLVDISFLHPFDVNHATKESISGKKYKEWHGEQDDWQRKDYE